MTAAPSQLSLYIATTALIAPLLAFGIILLTCRQRPKVSASLSIGAIGLSLVCSVSLLAKHWQMKAPVIFETTWLVLGEMQVPLGILLDPISLLMLLIVATISFLVQLYSMGYMAGDPGFGRYYGCMSLFAWAMLTLTISSSLLQMFIFWELVGLASYFLIGFWFEKFSASQAGKKAFVMTRMGDVAFLIGLILIWQQMGTLDIEILSDPDVVHTRMSTGMITLTALLIFGGIIGKSAQFPLLTWLPDAMEGPTPVSALLHSATMVAAGVYLFSRLFGFFSLSPTAMTVCLVIGTISMLLASTMAMVARDIKQVWAYSTISQLGYMLMGLGAGSLFGGFFHLMTHAGFKALLFLTAGVFIHHYDTNDMFYIGQKGGRTLKTAMICLFIAGGALSGLPPLAGFFSKEVILGRLLDLNHPIWFIAGTIGVFLTAYYTFRLIFIILFPKGAEATPNSHPLHDPHGPHSHGYGGAEAMSVVLWVLALITLALGFLQTPLENFIAHALGAERTIAVAHHGWLAPGACSLAIVAIGLAWLEFGRRQSAQVGFVERLPALATLFANRWYIDHLYRYFLNKLVDRGISRLFAWNDRRIIDGVVDGLGISTISLGRIAARLHTGMIQHRLMVMFAVIIILTLYFVLGAP